MPPSLTVGDVGERSLIDRIRSRAGLAPSGVVLGIGDDAAVLESSRARHDVLTTDSLVEGVHFRLDWTAARSVGRKAVLVNLSDLAAMAARPRALLLSICLPSTLALSDFDELIDGVLLEAQEARAPLVGGNITSSPGPLIVTVTASGSVHPRRMLARSTASAGDELYVTGTIGGARAGLEVLQAETSREALTPSVRACVERYELPPSRTTFARLAAGYRAASACMDLSDGLADAVRQIATASGTGAEVEAADLPVDAGAREWWLDRGADVVLNALEGGEDYELLFAVPVKKRRRFLAAARKAGDTSVARIGTLTRTAGFRLRRGETIGPLPGGFTHFSDNSK